MVFECGVEQVDVHHAALGAGFFGRVQHLDVVANPERPHREDQERAEQVGQHAPGGKKRHRTHGGKAGERCPEHGRRDAHALQHQQQRAGHDDPADQPVHGHHEFVGHLVVGAGTAHDAAQHALQQPGHEKDQQDLRAGDDDLQPVLYPVGQAGFQELHAGGHGARAALGGVKRESGKEAQLRSCSRVSICISKLKKRLRPWALAAYRA